MLKNPIAPNYQQNESVKAFKQVILSALHFRRLALTSALERGKKKGRMMLLGDYCNENYRKPELT